MSNLHDEMVLIGRRAKAATRELVRLSTGDKRAILAGMANEVMAQQNAILAANARDMEAGRNNGLSDALLDRLLLTPERLEAMADGMLEVAELPDPVGKLLAEQELRNGIALQKVAVAIGTILVIYESRPNVTGDAASLCLMAGNAIILRGGKEALESNRAIAQALIDGGTDAGMPQNAVQFVDTPDREAVRELARLSGLVDLIIPRGGEKLIEAVCEMATVPVLKHGKGVCAVYVDETADLDMAARIVVNAKTQRPGVCNAIENLVIHQAVADEFVPRIVSELRELGVEIRGDEEVCTRVSDVTPATNEDWGTEYLDLVLSVKVVPSLEAGIDFINEYGSGHSDSIVASDAAAQNRFACEVDSAAVYVNTSTRFTDGAEFDLGAEIGISTDRLHARGPVGLEGLVTYKYVGRSNGLIRK